MAFVLSLSVANKCIIKLIHFVIKAFVETVWIFYFCDLRSVVLMCFRFCCDFFQQLNTTLSQTIQMLSPPALFQQANQLRNVGSRSRHYWLFRRLRWGWKFDRLQIEEKNCFVWLKNLYLYQKIFFRNCLSLQNFISFW